MMLKDSLSGSSRLRNRSVHTLRAFAVIALLVWSAPELSADTVTATWNRNSESNIAGYTLSYGTQSGTYATSIDVGNVTTRQIVLNPGRRYYFVVQAYNTSSQFSPRSAEVFFDVGVIPPTITSLSPTSGSVGMAVTINGTNFGTTQGTVRFNGMTATPTTWTATRIVASVPGGATTGPVVVTAGGVASHGVSFTVVGPAPSITSLAPTSGPVGTVVTITGANFGATKGTSTVTFNGTLATPTTWSATSLVVPVAAGATTGNVIVTVGGVTSNARVFTVTTSTLPAPWTSQDIGSPAQAGRATWASATFSVTGGGADIWNTSDQFRFAYQTLDGDGEIVARVTTLQNSDLWAKAGVMIREDLTGGARNAMAQVTAGNGMTFQRRVTRDGPSTSTSSTVFAGVAPFWVRLVRSGNTFSGYYSETGAAWILMGSSVVPMPSRTYVGLAVTSHAPSLVTTGTFSNVSVTGTTIPTPPSITTRAPTSGVVGTAVTITGTNFGATKGTSAVTFNGVTATPTTWSNTSLVMPVPAGATTGNIVVTVGGVASNGVSFTVVGPAPSITTRAPTSGAVGTSVTITDTNFGATKGTSTVAFNGVIATPTTWSNTSLVVPVPAGATTGNIVVTVGGVASNGVSFTVVGPAPSITSLAPTSGPVGTVVTIPGTNFGTTKGTSTVTFNGTFATPTTWSATSLVVPVPAGATTGNVVVTVGGVPSNARVFTVTTGTLPAPWTGQDIGNPALAGRASWTSGTFSVAGAGADIWNTSDQFRFVYQTLDGDGEIVARVTTLQNSDLWAKAGVMIREDLTGGARNAMAQVTAGSGMTFQRRVTRDGLSTSNIGFPGVAPNWVRLVRSGNTFHGYYSATGTGWILMGSIVVPMPARTYVGLAVTSHNPSVVTTGTFTNVTVTTTAPLSMSSLVATSEAVVTSAVLAGTDLGTPTGTSTAGSPPVAPPTDGDYDGDGKTDVTVMTPATGTWAILESSTGTALTATLGAAGDTPAPGDYEGDGKTDIAVYHPGTGEWSVLLSSTGALTAVTWGSPTDLPVPADYDGDGKTDIVTYRPATGEWVSFQSSTQTTQAVVWGSSADVPVPGDYDGDAKADLAVYRHSTGLWQILQSGTNTTTTATPGSPGDLPMPGDYDGDGKTDVAVYHASTGLWSILQSSTNTTRTVTWGRQGDVPMPGDYDGDGTTDLAVFRPRTGVWRILQSSTNTTTVLTWGTSTDIPVP